MNNGDKAREIARRNTDSGPARRFGLPTRVEFKGRRGERRLRYAAVCVAHGRHLHGGSAAQAARLAEGCTEWCDGCRDELRFWQAEQSAGAAARRVAAVPAALLHGDFDLLNGGRK